MTRDPRYDILFEPVRIGPHVARNRFYQVPHCNGMGHRDASALAAMRGMKAEGGWAVVCTEMVEIHHTADVSPYVELRLWSDHDIPMLARIAEKVHEHSSLAGIELCHSGYTASNLATREVPIAASPMPTARQHCAQSRRASTSSMSMPATGWGSSSTSCHAPPISARMNMAARWRTAPACCAR